MNYSELLKKYDVPVPRYTSYPTVPYWNDSPTGDEWVSSLKKAFQYADASWSMYVHMPFCETLCTFCGCNTTITKSHDKESHYVDLIHSEFEAYLRQLPELKTKPLRQLHLGGGSPTFFSAGQLERLVAKILSELNVDMKNFEGAVEVDPRRTTVEQLEVLYELGFRRISLGVQDFDAEVQRLVNRTQPLEITRKITDIARELGYQSVNFDLIYGLPKQQVESFSKSIQQTIQLKPDRIALYSFAKVPWIKPQQRLFKDEDLPEGKVKRDLYEMARQQLIDGGYVEIGMDHFALPNDEMAQAALQKRLHRNFMGYSDIRTQILLGLGVSSISETPDCFHQNEKVLPVYERRVSRGEIPTLRGHKLNPEDQRQREQILEFMCTSEVKLVDKDQELDVRQFLSDMIQDGLVRVSSEKLSLTDLGRPFLRNACVALDKRLRRSQPTTKVFSQAL